MKKVQYFLSGSRPNALNRFSKVTRQRGRSSLVMAGKSTPSRVWDVMKQHRSLIQILTLGTSWKLSVMFT